MKKILLIGIMYLMFIILILNTANALVDDFTDTLSNKQISDINGEIKGTGYDLCLVLVEESRNPAKDAIKEFNLKYRQDCDLLVYYAKKDREKERAIAIVQPEDQILLDNEIKNAILLFEKKKRKTSTVNLLKEIMEELKSSLGNAPTKSFLCTQIKDGICDKQCPGTDLDCLCGNKICEYFETESICPEDCANRGWLCTVITDKSCQKNCIVTDIDCRIENLDKKMEQISIDNEIKKTTIMKISLGIVVVLAIILLYLLRISLKAKKKEETKEKKMTE